VSEKTPEQIAAELMDRYAMIDEADHMLRDDIAAAARSAIAQGLAAAGTGEGEKRYKEALEEIAQEEESGYGYYHGGDPRKFYPDFESCTPEEIAAHKKACEEWTESENAAKPSLDAPLPGGWLAPNLPVTVARFGIGWYTHPIRAAKLARSALKQGEGGK